MYKLAIFAAALLIVASTAQGAGFGNTRDTVILDCGAGQVPDMQGHPPPQDAPVKLLVVAVSGTPGAPLVSGPCDTPSALWWH